MSFKEKVASKIDGLYADNPQALELKQKLDAAGAQPRAIPTKSDSIEGRLVNEFHDNRRRPAKDHEDPNEVFVGKNHQEALSIASARAITPETIAAEPSTQEFKIPTQEDIDAAERAGDVAMTHTATLETQEAQADFEAASRAINAEEPNPDRPI